MAIPKQIHYCWFGQGNMPDLAKKCISSWMEQMPDYELILWNEDSFDINSNQFTKEAHAAKKYAFVSDYVRLYALYHHGGIYMDTDVEVVQPLDKFLIHRAFTGCESETICMSCVIGAEKKHPWIKNLLDYYTDRKFVLEDGSYDQLPNTVLMTKINTEKYGWEPQNTYQTLKDDLHIYPIEFFCATDVITERVHKTDKTYTVHHFAGSWLPMSGKIKKLIKRVLGEKASFYLVSLKRKLDQK